MWNLLRKRDGSSPLGGSRKLFFFFLGIMSVVNNGVLYFCILAFCLNSFIPLVDYYSPWYAVGGISAVMLFYLSKAKPSKLFNGIGLLFLGALLVWFQYWVTHREADFTGYSINGVIAWIPCIIALLCNSVIKLKYQKKILQVSFVIISFTAITTILGLMQYPFASRELATPDIGALREVYTFLNIGGYEFIYSLVISIPLIVWLIKNTKGCLKVLNVLILLVIIYCIYMSVFTTALVLTLVAGILLFIAMKPNSKPFIIGLIILFLILYYSRMLAAIVFWISTLVESDYVSDRLLQFAMVLDGTDVNNINTNTTTERIDITQRAVDGFLSSPLFGNNIISFNRKVLSGHSLIIDLLSGSGLLGVLLYARIFYTLFKKIFLKSYLKVNIYVRISWILFIAVSVANPTNFPLIYYTIFPLSIIVDNLSMDTLK